MCTGVDRSRVDDPNACLVVSEGASQSQLVIGLAASHPRCRVNIAGTGAPTDLSAAWSSGAWMRGDAANNKLNNNDAIHLQFRLDTLVPGVAQTVQWAYVLSQEELTQRMDVNSSLVVHVAGVATQPVGSLLFVVAVSSGRHYASKPTALLVRITGTTTAVVACVGTGSSSTCPAPTVAAVHHLTGRRRCSNGSNNSAAVSGRLLRDVLRGGQHRRLAAR